MPCYVQDPMREGTAMKIVVLTLLLCMASAAHANDVQDTLADAVDPATTTPTRQTEKVVPGKDDEMVCERKKKLGSNMVERVCMTVAQRDAEKQKAKDDISRLGRCSGNDSICSGSL